jgi:hypothetical protein
VCVRGGDCIPVTGAATRKRIANANKEVFVGEAVVVSSALQDEIVRGRLACHPWPAMKDEQHRFLMVHGKVPARLTAEQAAWVLNCQPHDIPILVAAKMIKPLGNPPANGIKFFAATDLLEAMNDRNWLARVSNTIYQHWHRRNANRRKANAMPAPAQDQNTTPGGQ